MKCPFPKIAENRWNLEVKRITVSMYPPQKCLLITSLKEKQKIEKKNKKEEIGDTIKLCKNKEKNRRRKCDIAVTTTIFSPFRRIFVGGRQLLFKSYAGETYSTIVTRETKKDMEHGSFVF